MTYDLAIIGGGPGGYTAADEAARRGMSVVLFEKDKLGGTCLNRGCIPTKALLHETEHGLPAAEDDSHEDVQAKLSEQDTREDVHVEDTGALAALIARRDEVVDTLRSGIEKLMRTRKVEVVTGAARIVESGLVQCGGETYAARSIIVACGSKPALPPLEGIELPGVYTSDALLEGMPPELSSLVIVGGGVIGMEMALLYAQMGIEVHVLEAQERILPPFDREISQRVSLHAKKRGIAVETSTRVERISGAPGTMQVSYLNKKGEVCELEAAGVLIATGRKPATENLFTAECAPELDRGALVAHEHGETSIKGIYVIGDARAGGIQLAHAAEAQARNVVAHLAQEEPSVNEELIPCCVYLSPEVASVGLTEDEARAQGLSVSCAKALTGANGKCLIEGGEAGYAKLVCDASSGKIVGAQLVCPRATDLIAELALAISLGATAEQLASVVHPHPTVSELVAEAARAVVLTE